MEDIRRYQLRLSHCVHLATRAWRRRFVVCLSALASGNSNWELVSHFCPDWMTVQFWCQLRLIYLCACSPTILVKSPWDSTAIFIFFCHFSGSLLKQCIIFEIFLQFYLPPPYTKLKLGKKSGYTRPTLFVGWGEGLDLCELENAPETQKCPETFVHDCSYKGLKASRCRLSECAGLS